MTQDTNRATGKTTGLMLQAIGKAIENPGKEVEFIDHCPQTTAQLHQCRQRIENIVQQLNFDITVKIKPNKLDDRFRPEAFSIFVKSNWVSHYSKQTLAKEAFKKVFGRYPDKWDWDYGRWHLFQIGFEAAHLD